ncbi:MAG: FAD binding domain-containing protein [Chloroflexi bacterium]|nr:FAD binding domain-containing protein [Chloroflexota bacterium]
MFYKALPAFNYLAPSSLAEACSLLAKHETRARVMAGGTDLVVQMKQRKIVPEYLVSLKGIPGLDYVKYDNKLGLRIGAAATLQSVLDSPPVQEHYDFIATALKKMGPPQVKNMATAGGNLCNAGPSADLAPPLLAAAARLRLVNSKEERIIDISRFFKSPFETVLGPSDILVEIMVAAPRPHTAGAYCYLTKLTEADETLVGAAAYVNTNPARDRFREVRLGLCSVAPAPIRAVQAEKLLANQPVTGEIIEKAAAAAAAETSPRSRAGYRRRMTAVLVEGAIREALGKVKGA